MLNPASRHSGQEHRLVIHALRNIQGWNRAFAAFVVLAIPVALFHYASGRIGNGLMATGAILLGATLIALDLRDAEVDVDEQETDDVVLGPDDFWWPDAADHLHDDAWLDRVTDEPLPGPFQAVLDDLHREHAQNEGLGKRE